MLDDHVRRREAARHGDGTFGQQRHSAPEQPSNTADSDSLDPEFKSVLQSAALLQQHFPDAVLVGGSAAAYWARHRLSTDHDHTIPNLASIYDDAIATLNRDPSWSPARYREGQLILGSYHGVEAGLRQLRRQVPLETTTVRVGPHLLRIPTARECLRIKGFLLVQRNSVRDYVDTVALVDYLGAEEGAATLSKIGDFYPSDMTRQPGVSVLGQLVGRLAVAEPSDIHAIEQLREYKSLDRAYRDWAEVSSRAKNIAELLEYPNG